MSEIPTRIVAHYHKDGSLHARGTMAGELLHGYWEWFRKEGTKLRSGHFTSGQQTGEWVTYDKAGAVYKVTTIKPRPSAPHLPGKPQR